MALTKITSESIAHARAKAHKKDPIMRAAAQLNKVLPAPKTRTVKGAEKVSWQLTIGFVIVSSILLATYFLAVFLKYKALVKDYRADEKTKELYGKLCLGGLAFFPVLLLITFITITWLLENENFYDVVLGGHGASEWMWGWLILYSIINLILVFVGKYVILDYIETENAPPPTASPTGAPTPAPTVPPPKSVWDTMETQIFAGTSTFVAILVIFGAIKAASGIFYYIIIGLIVALGIGYGGLAIWGETNDNLTV